MWSLTAYEMNRTPQEIPVNDTRVVHTQARILESELQCPICLDILRNTRTTKECLHRFCEECIGTALRNGNKECPKCRKKLISMRALRPDPTFDKIIETIFRNRAEMDQKHQALLDKLDKNKSDGSSGMETRNGASSSAGASGSQMDLEEVGDAHFVLQPWKGKIRAGGNEPLVENWSPKKRYIKVKENAKVEHICRFILTRFLVERPNAHAMDVSKLETSKVEIYMRPPKDVSSDRRDYQLLPNGLTLAEVRDDYWKNPLPMELFFAFNGNIKFK